MTDDAATKRETAANVRIELYERAFRLAMFDGITAFVEGLGGKASPDDVRRFAATIRKVADEVESDCMLTTGGA